MHDPVLNSSIQTDELLNVDNKEVINSSIKTDEFSPVKTDEIIDLLPFNFPAIDAFPANDFRSIGFTHHSEILTQCKDRKEPAIIFFAVRGATIPQSDFLFARRKTVFRLNMPLNQVVSLLAFRSLTWKNSIPKRWKAQSRRFKKLRKNWRQWRCKNVRKKHYPP